MTVQEFYQSVGGGYDEVMARMLAEERVVKFLGMFLRDPSYEQLAAAMDSGDMVAAFEAAHTLKGVSANLAMTDLNKLAVDITDKLRNETDIEGAKALFPEIRDCYERVVQNIQQLQ